MFVDGEPEFLLASRAHHADIGGSTPGSMPLSTTIHEEGIIIPPTRIREGGVLKETLLQEIILSTRDHEEREGDLRAQIASLDTGEKRMRELLEKYSLLKINNAASGLLDYGERLMRGAIEKIPDGDYVFTDYIEDDGAGTRDIPIKAKINVSWGHGGRGFQGKFKEGKRMS